MNVFVCIVLAVGENITDPEGTLSDQGSHKKTK